MLLRNGQSSVNYIPSYLGDVPSVADGSDPWQRRNGDDRGSDAIGNVPVELMYGGD